LYVTPSVERVLGMSPSELVGKIVYDLVEADQCVFFKRALADASQGALVCLRHSFRNASGGAVQAVTNFYPDRGGSDERALYPYRAVVCQTNEYASEQARRSRAGLPPPNPDAPAFGLAPTTNNPAPPPIYHLRPLAREISGLTTKSLVAAAASTSRAGGEGHGGAGDNTAETFQAKTSTFKSLLTHPSQVNDSAFGHTDESGEDQSWMFDLHSLRLQVRLSFCSVCLGPKSCVASCLYMQNRKLKEELDALESAVDRKKKRRARLESGDDGRRFSSTASSSSATAPHQESSASVSSSTSSPWQSEQQQQPGAGGAGGSAASGSGGRKPPRQCANCGRLDSPEWRKGPDGQRNLCNRCGLRWSKAQSIAKAAAAAAAATASVAASSSSMSTPTPTPTPLTALNPALASSSDSTSVGSSNLMTPIAGLPPSPYDSVGSSSNAGLPPGLSSSYAASISAEPPSVMTPPPFYNSSYPPSKEL
jgi:hypothetical protein